MAERADDVDSREFSQRSSNRSFNT